MNTDSNMYIFLTVVHIFLKIVNVSCDMEEPIVETKLGKYRGHYMTTLEGRQISAFNGIRYAKPPVNQLRFKDPEMIDAHEGIYDASKDGDDCLQVNGNYNKYLIEESEGKKYVGSEDCLFLNVYTPNIHPSKKYPVMIYIHGGSYETGTGSINWHGPHLLLDKDVILVAINYRLGIFGFISVDDEVLPGNLGLKDQSLAIHWVYDNIESFGGDPELITVMGHSAGGPCAQLQALSPRNQGIIKRVILQSGNLECPFGFIAKKDAQHIALHLAALLKCPESPREILKCLQEKSSEEIMDAVDFLKKTLENVDFPFLPVFERKEDGFITEEDYNKGSIIPLMTGVTKDEGVLLYRGLYRAGDGSLSNFNSEYKRRLPVLFRYVSNSKADTITQLIKQFYFDKQEIHENIDQFIKMVTDGRFIYDTLKTTKLYKGKNYLYVLTHQGQKSLTNELPISRVCHGDELFYLYPFSKSTPKLEFNEVDSKVQKLFVQIWSNFATYGNPTGDESDVEWKESENGKNYVAITSEGLELSQHLYQTRMDFWDNLFSNFISQN